MKVSIVIPVYNSHEIVRRQLLHFAKMPAMSDPRGVEVIIVDDKSDPPIEGARLRTDNKLMWTQGLARNAGAAIATGEYLFMTDIDHIISNEALEDALDFDGNKMIHRRRIAILDENGNVRQDRDTLIDWGYDYDAPPRSRFGPLDASVHGNTWVMRHEVFDQLGGYDEFSSAWGFHPKSKRGDDCFFNRKWHRAFPNLAQLPGRDIYLFPIGRWNKYNDDNPKGLFHDLHRIEKKSYKGEQSG